MFVVQVRESSEGIPYDGLFGEGRNSYDFDMEQSFLEIGKARICRSGRLSTAVRT
jgi:hypothetical protein